MKLVVIPACGGSKRILPRPMTKWSLEVALLRRCFDQFIVFTAEDGVALTHDV